MMKNFDSFAFERQLKKLAIDRKMKLYTAKIKSRTQTGNKLITPNVSKPNEIKGERVKSGDAILWVTRLISKCE